MKNRKPGKRRGRPTKSATKLKVSGKYPNKLHIFFHKRDRFLVFISFRSSINETISY